MQKIFSDSHIVLQTSFWKYFCDALEILSEQDAIFIGLSGGSSLDIFYAEIRERFSSLHLDIRSKVRFCLLDERVVPLDHPDSNLRQLHEKFLRALIEQGFLNDSQILSVDIDADNIAGLYGEKVLRIDIALFGVGGDGHIASLFPHHLFLTSVEGGYLEITDSPKPPAHRITVSPEMIRAMKYVYIAFMRGKEEVYEKFLDPHVSVTECPAKMVKKVENLVVMSDIDLLNIKFDNLINKG